MPVWDPICDFYGGGVPGANLHPDHSLFPTCQAGRTMVLIRPFFRVDDAVGEVDKPFP